MKMPVWVLPIMLLGMLSCGVEEPTQESTVATVVDDDIEVQVSIAPELNNHIQLVSVSGKKPGALNPIDAAMVLRNTAGVEKRLLVAGEWQTGSGQGRGGSSSVQVVGAGATATFKAGTRSPDVTLYQVTVTPETMTEDVLVGATIAAAAGQVEGFGIAYTATPTLDVIPQWRPRGTANGEFFEAGTILFTPFESNWKLQIIDREIDPLQGIAMARTQYPDLQTIHINLPDEPTSGAIFEREMTYGGGYFQIKTAPTAMATTSWNSEIAWVIEIDEWNRQPWRDNAGTFQQGGTVSGRLYICFKGSTERMKSSFVAGFFEDAPIVYYGPPR